MQTDPLSRFSEAFAVNDSSAPWPGPVPLTGAPSDQIAAVGRDADRRKLLQILKNHALVVVYADSGVGKSSFLSAKVGPALDERYTPLRVDDWSGFAQGLPPSRGVSAVDGPQAVPDVDSMLFVKLFGDVPPPSFTEGPASSPGEPGPRHLGLYLEMTYGRNVVLILDQFEELIRDSPRLFHAMGEWIDQMVLNHSVRIVLSLRSEYHHRVKGIGRVAPSLTREMRLDPIVDERFIRQIVVGPSDRAEGSLAIDSGAVDRLLDVWSARISVDEEEPPGLLQLQALLYVLAHRARSAGATVITLEHVDALRVSALNGEESLFSFAMTAAVDLKLRHCEEAGEAAGLDPAFRAGAKSSAQRCVGHLSSGGFKLVVRDGDLFNYALEREIRVHRSTGHVDQAEFAAAVEIVTPSLLVPGSAEQLDAEGGRPHLVGGTPHDGWLGGELPWDVDPEEITSGNMMGMYPGDVLREEVRRFLFALKWLEIAKLIRTTTPRPGQTMVALIHDGFSDPLEKWARGATTSPEQAVHFLTAARGQTFDWRISRHVGERGFHSAFDGRDAERIRTDWVPTRLITNARWRDCRVSGSFRSLTFVNCDFQGTRFDDCWFEGVVFLNCMLDGASIRNSTIVGRVDPPDSEFTPEPPSFTIEAPEEARNIASYRRGRSILREPPHDVRSLFSETSGLPVLPVTGLRDSQVQRTRSWRPEPGGLSFYGGRVYSLMIERCDFGDRGSGNGSLAFHGISGSSLDIVDPADAHVLVRGSAIRGLSVTVNDEARRGPQTRNLDLDASDSLLAGTWLGDELVGTLTFDNCSLWQMWNNSALANDRTQGLRIRITNSAYIGLVNTGDPDTDSPVLGSADVASGPPVFDVSERDGSVSVTDDGAQSGRTRNLTGKGGSSMVDGANRMEYQAQPALQEFARRRRQEGPPDE